MRVGPAELIRGDRANCSAHHRVRRVQDYELRKQLFGFRNVEVRSGNGYYGWSEHAPYDKIIVTAAPDLIPPPLIAQLRSGGRMVIPTGIPEQQQLVLVETLPNGKLVTREILPVRFTPLENSADLAGAA